MNTNTGTTLAGSVAALGIANVALRSEDPVVFWSGLLVTLATAIFGYLTNK